MIGLFRLETQMLSGTGKFDRTGIGSDRECRESSSIAFNFLKANSNRISQSINNSKRLFNSLSRFTRHWYDS